MTVVRPARSGPAALRHACKLQPGLPIKPMLAKASEGVVEALRSLAGASDGVSVLGEFKYDGQRAQIHLTDARQASAAAVRQRFLFGLVVSSASLEEIKSLLNPRTPRNPKP